MERVKLETQVNADLMRGIKERGLREGKDETKVIEEALNNYLRAELLCLVEETARRSGLAEEEAIRLADEELQKSRSGR